MVSKRRALVAPVLVASLFTPAALASPLPIAFEANQGQTDPAVAFAAHGPHASLFVSDRALVTVLPETSEGPGVAVFTTLRGARHDAPAEGLEPLEGRVHYLVGDSAHPSIATFERVRQRAVYPGIDLVLRMDDGAVEYDFDVAPGADPDLIVLDFAGADALAISPEGDLVVLAQGRAIHHRRPIAWQTVGGREVPVAIAWTLDDSIPGGHSAHFALGAYDPRHPLLIDPPFAYSSYLGGSSNEHGKGVTTDAEGYVYVVGQTLSPDFPLAPGALPIGSKSQSLAFVTKLDPNATGSSGLVWSTYLGGANGGDTAKDVAVDAAGHVYVVGWTTSTSFPVTASALQNCSNLTNGNSFLSKLAADGASLLYSTCFSGDNVDELYGVKVDAAERAYLVGRSASSNFPTTANAFQPFNTSYLNFDAVALVVDTLAAGQSSLLYSTYFGDCGTDEGESIEIDADGVMYMTGSSATAGTCPNTAWKDLALAPRAGGWEGWVTKLDPWQAPADQVIFSTFLGGKYDEDGQPSGGIGLDAMGNVFVAGSTTSPDFPVTGGAIKTTLGGNADGFFTVFSPTGQMLYSTYLGGSFNDFARGLRVGKDGLGYITGTTSSANMPVTACTSQGTMAGAPDAFLMLIDPWAGAVVYSTFIGGGTSDNGYNLALDPDGNTIVVGETSSGNFPVTSGAFQTTHAGAGDAFVTKVYTPADCALPGIRIADTSVVEGNLGSTWAIFDIYLFGSAATPVSVLWETSDHTATAGADYVWDSGEVVFEVGETHQTIAVEVLGDWGVEGDERFYLNIAPGSGDVAIQDSLAIGRILDDDVEATISVTLSGPESVVEGDAGTYAFVHTGTAPADTLVADCGLAGLLIGAVVYDAASGLGSFECDFADGPADSTVSITVSDLAGASASASLSVSVANAAPAVELSGDALADEGTTHDYAFTVTDAGSDGFSVSGDPDCGAGGTYVAGSLVTTPGGGGFACTFPDGPASPQLSLLVSDDDGAVGAAVLSVAVANVAPGVVVSGQTGVAEGDTVSFDFAVSEPGDDLLDLIEISCGVAGALVPGSLTQSGAAPLLTGSFACAFGDGPADSEVAVTAIDSDGASATGTLDVAVMELAPIATLIGPAAALEGASVEYTFAVDSNNGFTLAAGYPDCGTAGALVADSVVLTSAGGTFDCTFPDGPEVSEVAVQVVDLDLAPGNVAFITVAIEDVAPLASLSGATTVPAGSTGAYQFTVTDPGPDAFALALGSPECGAGVLVAGSLVVTSAGGSFECAFPSAGTTTVAVQVESAGLTSDPATLAITVEPVAPVAAGMSGHGQMDFAGDRAAHGFGLHCDAGAAGQRLQVSWGGHRFSLELVATLACSDDSEVEPGGGVPIDTLSIDGQGRLDGVPGASVTATFTDAGEPGSEDRVALEIRDADGAVVLSVSGPLLRGNHQARIE